MSRVKRNVIANLIGGALLAALTIVITPLQINILGLEAYGVVGFITTMQIAFTAFDLGLSSTLTRELAADSSPHKEQSTDLLRTASTIYWGTALVIGLVIAALAGQMAQRWFNITSLQPALLEQSLQVIALYLALRWPVSLYVGVLTGLQRMDVLNAVRVATAALRLVGGLLVLLQWRSLYAFLVWTAFIALVEVAIFWCACKWVHPSMPARPGISWPALQRVWRFSISMNGLAILTVLIVQADKLFISKMLPLEALGAYSLAYNAAAIIPALIGAIASAVLPSFAAAFGAGSTTTLHRRYDGASRVMFFIIGMVTATLVFFGEALLAVWVNPSAAAEAAMPLALLAVGFWGSAAASNAYQVAVAAGRPNVALRVSVLTMPVYLVALYGLIATLGITGAALAWLLLNALYVIFLVPLVHRLILDLPVGTFLLRVLAPFTTLALVTFGLARMISDINNFAVPAGVATYAAALFVYAALGWWLLGQEMRRSVWSSLRMRTSAP